MTQTAEAKNIYATIANGLYTVVVGDTSFEISRAGKVTIVSDELTTREVQRKPAPEAKGEEDGLLTIEDNGFGVYGVKVEVLPEGGFAVYTNSVIDLKAATPLEIGEKMEDGSIYAGLTKDGKQQIFVAPKDLPRRGSFNQAAEALKKLNENFKMGHNDWQIGTVDVMQVVRKNLNGDPAKRDFRKSLHMDSHYPDRLLPGRAYLCLTSTANAAYKAQIATVRFTEGKSPYSHGQLMRMKMHTLKLRLKQAFDKKHYYPIVRYNTKGYPEGHVRYEYKNSGRFNCCPVRLVPLPRV